MHRAVEQALSFSRVKATPAETKTQLKTRTEKCGVDPKWWDKSGCIKRLQASVEKTTSAEIKTQLNLSMLYYNVYRSALQEVAAGNSAGHPPMRAALIGDNNQICNVYNANVSFEFVTGFLENNILMSSRIV
jgi:hypothetical protein